MPPSEHNLAWLASNFPCRSACPVGTHAGGYVSLIATGHVKEAYALARRPNPLASVCGLICAHPCESACRRDALDDPISIRALKRYATERFGVESKVSFEEIASVVERPRPAAGKPGKVAVLGAGPAGLACAHDLALMGHRVTILDAAKVAGGMLRLGIPAYRLPREILDREVDFVRSLGVEIRLGVEVGRDVSFADLRRDHDAVFIATGCRKGRGLPIAGADHPGVLTAVDFLANVNLGHPLETGDDILVIGGGNVAFDAARSARRLEIAMDAARAARRLDRPGADAVTAMVEDSAGENPHMNLALDVARIAAFSMKKRVRMICLEDRHELPADEIELLEAEEEGIGIEFRRSPREVVVTDGKVTGVRTLDVLSVFDPDGRFNPRTMAGTEKVVPCDTVIIAIGQVADLSFLGADHGLAVSPRSTVVIDRETLATNLPGVYAGGDIAFGPRIAIEAVADGRRAALAIDTQITGRRSNPPEVVVREFSTFGYDHPFAAGDYEKIRRRRIPTREALDRASGQQVEVGYSDEAAHAEAARCLRCWINTVFDSRQMKGSECIQCAGCVDVCPEGCIDLVALSRISAQGDEARRFLLPDGADAPGAGGAALVKNEDACIRCGLCARRCPVGCVTMQGFYRTDEMDLLRLAESSI